MSDDREIDMLRRRLDRHVKWGQVAREMARDMFSDDGIERMVAEGWWRQQLDMPRVVHSLADVRAAALGNSDAVTRRAKPEGPPDVSDEVPGSTSL